MMRAAVTHLFFKDLLLTTISVPTWIELVNMSFCILVGFVLGVPYVRDCGCGLLLEMITNACIFYDF